MDSFTPKYVVIQNYILEKIESGILKPGDLVPSDNELAHMFGVSRVTVSTAISELRTRGIVTRVKGKGTFVSKREPSLFSSAVNGKLHSFKISSEGHADHHRLVGLDLVNTDKSLPNVTKLLLLAGEPCHRIARLMYADDDIIAFEYSYLPYSMYPHEIDKKIIENCYLHSFISEYCHKEPYRLQTHISIAFPDAPQKKYLKVSPNEPILVWYTAVIDAADMVLGYTETFARPEDFKPYINFML